MVSMTRVMEAIRNAGLATLAAMYVLGVVASTAAAENCPLFSEALESAAEVTSNGGTINGSVSFSSAVNGNGACFGSGDSISYSNSIFNAGAGSISFWFKKSGTDASGGLAQIGNLGQPNSLGVMYNSTSTLYVELHSDSASAQTSVPNAVSDLSFAHIVVSWQTRSDGVHVKVFRNGEFKKYMYVSGSFAPAGGGMDIGRTDWYPSALGCTDEFAFFDWPLLDSEVYAEYVVSGDRQSPQQSTRPVSTGPVKIIDGSLQVHGRPFVIRGVGYQPTPIGSWSDPAVYTNACILDRDIPLIRAMNANTVRLWATLPVDETLLDRLFNGGVDPIYAILSFWIDPGLDLSDSGVRATLESDFRSFVARFKNHSATLAWAIGNELNLAYGGSASDWYSLANDLAAAAHAEEGSAYHPTLIVNGGLEQLGDTLHGSDDVSLDDVDLWGVNAYFGDNDHCYFDYYERLSSKPVVITEFGVDAYDNGVSAEDQQAQADWDVLQWRVIEAKTLGGTVMAYSDEWWKCGNPAAHDTCGFVRDAMNDRFSNEEYWGVMSISDTGGLCNDVTPRLVYAALQNEWLVPGVPTFSHGGLILLAVFLMAAGEIACLRQSLR